MSQIVRIISRLISRLDRRKPLSYSQIRTLCQKNDTPSASDSAKNHSNVPASQKIPFEYPEPTIEVVERSKTFREIFDTDLAHWKKYAADPKNNTFRRPIFNREYEFVIIGAGPVGTSVAYWLRKLGGPEVTVLVIDKNLSVDRFSRDIDNGHLAAALSVGQLRQLYSLKENIELSQFGAQFLRNIHNIDKRNDDADDVSFKPFGYLTLATPTGSKRVKELFKNVTKQGTQYELLTSFQVKQRFPWINTEGIHLAAHGLRDEGWFDPWEYLLKLRSNAIRNGVTFMEAVPLEFQYSDEPAQYIGFESKEYRPTNHLVIKTSEGELKKIQFAQIILALGADTGTFAKEMLHIDNRYHGMHQFEIPIKRRKRYVYSFEAPDGPSCASPMIVDPSGLCFRREGLLNNFICSYYPLPNEELDTDNLDVDPNYFADRVWPLLAARVPSFEQLRLTASWAKFDEVNTFDGSPIIGLHPAYHNVHIVAGFGDRSFQHAIGAGKAVAEGYLKNKQMTIDLHRFTFHRIVQEIRILDSNIL